MSFSFYDHHTSLVPRKLRKHVRRHDPARATKHFIRVHKMRERKLMAQYGLDEGARYGQL